MAAEAPAAMEDIQQQHQQVQVQYVLVSTTDSAINNDGATSSSDIVETITAADATAASLELGGGICNVFRRPFDPVNHELDSTFRLTKYADLKGRGCRIPQETLTRLLEGVQDFVGLDPTGETPFNNMPKIGIGLDASITPLRHPGLTLVHATDFFYPLVDDPYMLGKIACSNVLSNLYAVGSTECDDLLMLLGVSTKLTDKERDVVVPLIMRGFKDAAFEAGCQISGGQTVLNPWLSIGGAASSVVNEYELMKPESAIPGDVLVLTKPLGTFIAACVHQWLEMPERWNRVKLIVSQEDVRKAYNRAMDSMARLNRNAARLMHKYNAHAAAAVSGYGLLGHAQNLAQSQKLDVTFVIHNLPVIAKMNAVARACGNMFQLVHGSSAETSGGLLICLPREQAAAYCKEIEKQEGYQAWIVGIVEKGNRTARIIDKPRVIEVPTKEREGELW